MAKDGCDAFAKEISQQVFNWLARRINQATCVELKYSHATDVDKYGTIGLLDILGFGSFQVNRFEQICINYANETLQLQYNMDIFKSVQDAYRYEGIELSDNSCVDNSNVVNLVAVLPEECIRPNGKDSLLVLKTKAMHKDAKGLINHPLYGPTKFEVSHEAENVRYDASFFVQKNNDKLPHDVVACASMCSSELISNGLNPPVQAKTPNSLSCTSSVMTGYTKFRSQLKSLVNNIGRTRSRYIRCITPNIEKVREKPISNPQCNNCDMKEL